MTDKQSTMMPSITELIHRRAWELMGDGDWYDFERAVLELGKLIPPGMARRRGQQRRAMSDARRERQGRSRAGWRPPPPTDAELILLGRRQWVVATIQSRPGKGPPIYEFDPPVTSRAGRNGYNRGAHIEAGRRMRILAPNVVIRGDQRRAVWIRPALERAVELMAHQRNSKGVAVLRQVAHESGMHLHDCPPDCVLNPMWKD